MKPIHETNVNNFWHNFEQPLQLRDALPAVISFTPPRRVDSPPPNLRLSEPEWKEATYSPPHIERHDAGRLHKGALAGEKSQVRGNHSALPSATGCSWVPGWRHLSLGRFAKADWSNATSALLWFYFRRVCGVVLWLVCNNYWNTFLFFGCFFFNYYYY